MTVNTHELACHIRVDALRMVAKAKASHIGTCLSIADLLSVIYSNLNVDPHNAKKEDRDRFLLSKGHGAAILYAILARLGFFPLEELATYSDNGSRLTGHVSHHVPGVEVSTGSLGHGLPIGCGLALAAQRDRKRYRTVVFLSDGELDEGSNWEAILFAGHHQLEQLTAVVDYNKIQSFGAVRDVLDLEPLADKWRAFKWRLVEIDGHDHNQIQDAWNTARDTRGQPTVILAHTVKGKGVPFMENNLLWHYKSPDAIQLADALAGLDGKGRAS